VIESNEIDQQGCCSEKLRHLIICSRRKYFKTMWRALETAFVGAEIGGGFVDTNKLQTTMVGDDAPKWHKAMYEEHERMQKH
jgi:hypothetical protein